MNEGWNGPKYWFNGFEVRFRLRKCIVKSEIRCKNGIIQRFLQVLIRLRMSPTDKAILTLLTVDSWLVGARVRSMFHQTTFLGIEARKFFCVLVSFFPSILPRIISRTKVYLWIFRIPWPRYFFSFLILILSKSFPSLFSFLSTRSFLTHSVYDIRNILLLSPHIFKASKFYMIFVKLQRFYPL